MEYRTRTYIAGDWTGDSDAIRILYEWNDNEHFLLSFSNAHDLTKSNDESNNCNIKKSLRARLMCSKTFILIVGNKTKELISGGCFLCRSYNSHSKSCGRGGNIDYRSYIEYECETAVKDYLNGELKKIVVLYNGDYVYRYSKCPEVLIKYGTHLPMKKEDGSWNYSEIRKAIMD